ncbi:MAG: cyclophilin-like fold protein [Anaerolineae bacterium]
MRQIRIRAGDVQVVAELNDTRTADAIWKALPLSAIGNRWGDEIYFSIPVKLQEENAQATVSLGDLGYWPPGQAFCIFFGPTPVSKGQEIRPASPVNVFGRVIGDPTVLKKVRDGETVVVEPLTAA